MRIKAKRDIERRGGREQESGRRAELLPSAVDAAEIGCAVSSDGGIGLDDRAGANHIRSGGGDDGERSKLARRRRRSNGRRRGRSGRWRRTRRGLAHFVCVGLICGAAVGRVEQRNGGAAAEDNEVGFDQAAFVFLLRLHINFPRDELKARNGSEIAAQKCAGLDQSIQIDIHWIGQAQAFWIYDQHLAGMQQHRFPDVPFAKDSPGSLEHDELDERVRVILQQYSGPGNGRRNRRGIDLGAAGIFRDAQEDGATAELEVARALVETKDRVRAEAGEGFVSESEFGPGLQPGAHGGALAHGIANARRARGGLGREQLHVLDHLGDARLFQLGGIHESPRQHECEECEQA